MSQVINQAIKTFEIPVNANGEPAPLEADGKLSYEAFLDWADEDTPAEWVDGVIEMTSPASYKHEDIGEFLLAVMRRYVYVYDLGRVVGGEFQMKLPKSGRNPDVIFIKKEKIAKIKTTFLEGPGDLVVEVVSPESVKRDYTTKFAEYLAGGVGEYWIIDQRNDTAKFYVLENGKYVEVKPQNGRYTSREIQGFWLQMDWLWQDPTPDAETIVRQIGGLDFRKRVFESQLADEGDKYAEFLIEELRKKGYLPPGSDQS
jgi:Uma2 family endonuclease